MGRAEDVGTTLRGSGNAAFVVASLVAGLLTQPCLQACIILGVDPQNAQLQSLGLVVGCCKVFLHETACPLGVMSLLIVGEYGTGL